MRLTELEPQFLRYETKAVPPDEFVDGVKHLDGICRMLVPVDTIQEAQGVRFLCPKCFAENKGALGTHYVLCWSRSRGIPDDVEPKPGRWTLEGTGYEDLTLNGDPPGNARSVLILGETSCKWHGFITKGEAA